MDYKTFQTEIENAGWEFYKGDHSIRVYHFRCDKFTLILERDHSSYIKQASLYDDKLLVWRTPVVALSSLCGHSLQSILITANASINDTDRVKPGTDDDAVSTILDKSNDKLSRDKFMELWVAFLKPNYCQTSQDFATMIQEGERQYALYLNQ